MMDRGGGDSGNLLMSLIPSNCPKPDLFLFQLPKQEPIDVTNYRIDDLINLAVEKESDIEIMCLYESFNLDGPIITDVVFGLTDDINISAKVIRSGIINNEIVYNNKTYYHYYQELI